MRCPFCAHEDSQVKDSRPSEDGAAIRRRRQCEACGARFTTFERVQLRDLTVVKKDGKRELFDRQKILNGLMRACEKRPISMSQLEAIVDDIEKAVQDSADRETSTSDIGKIIMRRLKALDKVAYVRFASVYLEFEDVTEFMTELKALVSSRKPVSSAENKKKRKK